MEPIRIEIPGEPVAWSRTRLSGKRHFHAPKYMAWREQAALCARSAMKGKKPLTGPIDVIVWATLGVPSAWKKWKRDAALSGSIRPTGTPDVDNYLKAVADSLNSIVWIDDAQMVNATAFKRYGAVPGVEVHVAHVHGAPAQITSQRAFNDAIWPPS